MTGKHQDERPPSRPRKIQPLCSTEGCANPSGYGITKRFCADCAARLASVKDQIQIEGARMHRGGLDPAARKKGKNSQDHRASKRRLPTCCTVGCFFPRVPPDAFCEKCQQAGAVEE